jgi:glycosyltransferase involved in cell wall biosynthesis
MRVIIIHHILWAHYKNAFYEELLKQADTKPDLQINILQIAKSENGREQMPLAELPKYKYNLLFESVLEDIPKLKIFKSLKENIDSFKPNVVNINGFFRWYHIAIIAYCKLKGIKVILSNDSTAGDNPRVFWKNLLKRFVIGLSDSYYTFGTLSAKYLIDNGADPNKFISKRGAVVNNSFIENAYNLAMPNRGAFLQENQISTQKNFIYVGRFIDFKNLYLLLNAFKKVQAINQEWGLILLGDGILKNELALQVAENQIDNVYFLGGKNWQEVPKYLTMADVLILPSKSEPWGLVVNEAMICGLPVVVADKCGCAIDLVENGINGFTFPFDDEQKLTEIMFKFVLESVDYNALSKNAEKKIKQFSVENAANDMILGFYNV